MAIYHFSQFAVEPITYFLNYMENNIADYELHELTNGHMGDKPNFVEAHPLAMEYGALLSAGDPDNYTSILPAVGIELLDDGENEKQLLGQGYRVEEITQAFVTTVAAIAMKDRLKDGILMSDTIKDALQAAITAKAGEKLWSVTQQYLQTESVNISIWSNNTTVTRLVYNAIKAILKRAKLDLATNYTVRNLSIKGQTALYNYEFGETLFGAEFSLTFMNSFKNIKVDTASTTIKSVEHHLMETGKAGPTFVPLS